MEPDAVWVPCDLQLANWTTEPVVYAPGLPVEYASTDMFGSCIQTSAPISNGQIIEYAAATRYDMGFKFKPHMEEYPNSVFKEAVEDIAADVKLVKRKIHKYPESIIRTLGPRERYTTVPMVVAIGPYHHHLDHLKKAEKMKHAAACHCIEDSGLSVQAMYDAVVAAAQGALQLYDKDVVARIREDDFLSMMFYDACFLVQFMFISYAKKIPAQMGPLCKFIEFNEKDIFHDIMLLQNQLPWPVVRTALDFMSQPPLQTFIAGMRNFLQDRKDSGPEDSFTSNEPPHLLGLLKYCTVGSNTKPVHVTEQQSSLSLSVSATELAEIGIMLNANTTAEVIDMGIKPKWIKLAQLSLAPLSLDDLRASCLVNMAVLQLSTTSNFQDAGEEESAVCSYLLLLAMLAHREEDVHMLRKNHILQGGVGFTNKEVLGFFTSIKGLPLGSGYIRTMEEIEHYKSTRRRQIKVFAFLYKYWKTITMVFGAISTLVTFYEKLK